MDYRQTVRDLIYDAVREDRERRPIHEIAWKIEELLREQVAKEIEAGCDCKTSNGRCNHLKSADVARNELR